MTDAYKPVRDFEAALCEYTGAPFAVTTTSCTSALLLAVAWHIRGRDIDDDVRPEISMPKRSYVGVPMSIIHAGGRPVFREESWSGLYQLKPLPVFDCARRFTSGMFNPVRPEVPIMQCVSFHASKILGDTQGGAILHDSPEADEWLRLARFDGRKEGVAPKEQAAWPVIGWHANMSPDVAARLLLKLSTLPQHNADLPLSDYPDLSKLEIFK